MSLAMCCPSSLSHSVLDEDYVAYRGKRLSFHSCRCWRAMLNRSRAHMAHTRKLTSSTFLLATWSRHTEASMHCTTCVALQSACAFQERGKATEFHSDFTNFDLNKDWAAAQILQVQSLDCIEFSSVPSSLHVCLGSSVLTFVCGIRALACSDLDIQATEMCSWFLRGPTGCRKRLVMCLQNITLC